MRFSSHLYFRTDGTLGHYPVISVDVNGVITEVVENERMAEMAHTRFFTGVIIPEVDTTKIRFGSREEFCRSMRELVDNEHKIAVGKRSGLLLLNGFDLNEFCIDGVSNRLIVNRLV